MVRSTSEQLCFEMPNKWLVLPQSSYFSKCQNSLSAKFKMASFVTDFYFNDYSQFYLAYLLYQKKLIPETLIKNITTIFQDFLKKVGSTYKVFSYKYSFKKGHMRQFKVPLIIKTDEIRRDWHVPLTWLNFGYRYAWLRHWH